MPFPQEHEMRLEFPTAEIASIVHKTVSLDPELRKDRVQRTFTQEDNVLTM